MWPLPPFIDRMIRWAIPSKMAPFHTKICILGISPQHSVVSSMFQDGGSKKKMYSHPVLAENGPNLHMWNGGIQGFESPDDKRILRGSCGLEYSLASSGTTTRILTSISWLEIIHLILKCDYCAGLKPIPGRVHRHFYSVVTNPQQDDGVSMIINSDWPYKLMPKLLSPYHSLSCLRCLAYVHYKRAWCEDWYFLQFYEYFYTIFNEEFVLNRGLLAFCLNVIVCKSGTNELAVLGSLHDVILSSWSSKNLAYREESRNQY